MESGRHEGTDTHACEVVACLHHHLSRRLSGCADRRWRGWMFTCCTIPVSVFEKTTSMVDVKWIVIICGLREETVS